MHFELNAQKMQQQAKDAYAEKKGGKGGKQDSKELDTLLSMITEAFDFAQEDRQRQLLLKSKGLITKMKQKEKAQAASGQGGEGGGDMAQYAEMAQMMG